MRVFLFVLFLILGKLVFGEICENLTPGSIGDAASSNGNPAAFAVDGNNSTFWEQIDVGDSIYFEFTSPEFIESVEIVSYHNGGLSSTPNVEVEVYVSNSKGLSSCPGTGWTLGGTFELCDVSDLKVTRFNLSQNAFSLCLASSMASCSATVNDPVGFRELNFYNNCDSVVTSPVTTITTAHTNTVTLTATPIINLETPTSTPTPTPTHIPQICNMNPDDVLGATATSRSNDSTLALDGDVNTFWNATSPTNEAWMANFTTQRFVSSIEIIAYAPNMPGRRQNKILDLYYSPNALSTICPGSGWIDYPGQLNFCDTVDFDVVTVENFNRNIRSICISYLNAGCSPADLIWNTAFREVNLYYNCSSPTPTPTLTPTSNPSSLPTISSTQTPSKTIPSTPTVSASTSKTSTPSLSPTSSLTAGVSPSRTPSVTDVPTTTISPSSLPIVSVTLSQNQCNMTSDFLDSDSTTARGASIFAIDGNNDTFWISSQFTGQAWMANFTTQRFVNSIEIIAYAPNMPGRRQNKVLDLYYSPDALSTICPGSGWIDYPGQLNFCDTVDFDVVTVENFNRNIRSICISDLNSGCSPADLVWRTAFREVNLYYNCSSPTPTPTLTPTSTQSATPSRSKSLLMSTSVSLSQSNSISLSSSITLTPSISRTPIPSTTPSMSITNSLSKTQTPQSTQSTTNTPTLTPNLLQGEVITESIRIITKSNTPTIEALQIITPSSSATQTSAKDCSNCEAGSIQIDLSYNEQASSITLTTNQGTNVGSVIIPNDLDLSAASIDISFVTNIPQRDSNSLGNSIFDIILKDDFGNSITNINSDVEICMNDNTIDDDDVCLSYFNEATHQWECQDKCLKQKGNEYCGTTNHFTSFALLLGANTNNDPCNSEDESYVIAWVSVALILVAIACFVIATIIIEIIYRKQRMDDKKQLEILTMKMESAMS